MRLMMRLMTVSVALAALVSGACGGEDEPVSSGNGDFDLEDPGEYRAVEIIEDGAVRDTVEGTVLTLRFENGQVAAHAGCNSIGGDYSFDGGVLEVEALSMTEMGCDPPRHDQDQWYTDFLSSGPAVEPTDDGFVLTAGSTVIRFVDRRVVEPDADLVGTTWVVDGFIDGDVAMSSAAPNGTGSLRFEDNGFVSGHDGCNDFGYGGEEDRPVTDGLSYEVVDDRITFDGEPVSTQMLCDDQDYERRYHAVLSGTVTYEIDATNLTLLAADGRGVTYRAER